MKFRDRTFTLLLLAVSLVIYGSPAYGQEDEYEYYYEDETTTAAAGVASTTTATTTTSTTMKTTVTTKKTPTRKTKGNIVAGQKNNGKQNRQMCNGRPCPAAYQYGRSDVVFNIIADMYQMQEFLPGYNRYMTQYSPSYNRGYSSMYQRPMEYWYGMRQPYRQAQRQTPTMIDYGAVRRNPGNQQNQEYGYDDEGEFYTDYYDYEYDYPADANARGSNRAIFNFILNALGPQRRN